MAKTIISIRLHYSKSRAFTRPKSFLLTCKDPSVINIPKIKGQITKFIRYNRVKFAYHFHMNYDLNLQTAEFLVLGLCDFGETLFDARH